MCPLSCAFLGKRNMDHGEAISGSRHGTKNLPYFWACPGEIIVLAQKVVRHALSYKKFRTTISPTPMLPLSPFCALWIIVYFLYKVNSRPPQKLDSFFDKEGIKIIEQRRIECFHERPAWYLMQVWFVWDFPWFIDILLIVLYVWLSGKLWHVDHVLHTKKGIGIGWYMKNKYFPFHHYYLKVGPHIFLLTFLGLGIQGKISEWRWFGGNTDVILIGTSFAEHLRSFCYLLTPQLKMLEVKECVDRRFLNKLSLYFGSNLIFSSSALY